jgi:hypothetical protein
LNADSGSLVTELSSNVLIVGVTNILETNGTSKQMSSLVVGSDGSIQKVPVLQSGGGGGTNGGSVAYRVSWRELVN